MKTGPDAGLRDLVVVVANVRPSMRGAGRRRAGHADFRDIRRAELGLDGGGDGAADDAMGARIFGMHRRVVDRLPGCVAFGGGIVVLIAVAGRWGRAPGLV